MLRVRSLAAAGLAVAGLALSAALLVDALRPAPAFCAAGGCAEVRASAWARPLGVPMPAVGLVFFALAALLACAGGARVERARRIAAMVGGAGALGLLAVQGLAIGAWCRLCVATDLIALAHAAAVLAGSSAWPRAGRARIALTAMAAAVAVAVPLAALRPDRGVPAVAAAATGGALPEVVAREQLAGTAVVVDFVDFECPFCRAFHRELTRALSRADVPVRVVRKMVPLPQHRAAFRAAVAWCCADAQGKGDEMAERLFAAADLSPAALELLAAQIGLDLDRFRADAASPATRARVEADLAAAEAAGVQSLPTVYIGGHRFVGAGASADQLVRALRAAAAATAPSSRAG
ncbi:MAG TPA: thioredoxin domain-containing protein [Kofleriaceae bacterium]|nr:thioredoxin domain-containing protein [Kofleriaceae bacterium]